MESVATRLTCEAGADARVKWEDANVRVMELGLAWVRSLLAAHIARMRAAQQHAPADFDKVVTDEAADWLLGQPERQPAANTDPRVTQARRLFDAARSEILDAGTPAAIDALSALFGLAPFDEDLLLLASAPRADAAFAALFGYAHDRVSITAATPHLARLLLTPESSSGLVRSRLRPDAPLRRFALLDDRGEAWDALAPLAPNERVADYVWGQSYLDPRVHPCLRPSPPAPCPARIDNVVRAFLRDFDDAAGMAACILGPKGSGKRAAAQMLAARRGLRLLELDPAALPSDPAALERQLSLLAREAVLGGLALAIVVRDPARENEGDRQMQSMRVAEQALLRLDAMVLVLAEEHSTAFPPVPVLRLPALEAADRAELLRKAVAGDDSIDQAAIELAAENFALGPSEIATMASGDPVRQETLWSTCRAAARQGMDGLAARIEPRYRRDDIVLPAGLQQDLDAIAAQVRHRTTVYRHWGFAARMPRGRGVSALFAGPSGVGKTMAAEIIANELHLDLFHIDLSGVVSKYIGETEKNLKRVFDAAEAAGAVLFFDEADALFGKRTEVKDSHDRYANIEVSYLLQRMESYGGLAILASNMKTHLDTAFLRRLRFVIDFPFPDSSLRRAIWAKAFPPDAPLEGVDMDALARLEIAGGNIQVIAVNAAFLAAAENTAITMEHVTRAARSEFRKIDRAFAPTWLGAVKL